MNRRHWIPIFKWARAYEFQWILPDLTAALTLTTIVVPQALAYSVMAGIR